MANIDKSYVKLYENEMKRKNERIYNSLIDSVR